MKRLVLTDTILYDINGKWLGREVSEVDAFTRDELRNVCPICQGANGHHKEYFVPNASQSGFGEVDGRWQPCPNGRGK